MLKQRFPILKQAPEYSVDTQAKIVRACCVLHNFIRLQEDLPDDPEGELEEEDSDDKRPDTYNHESNTTRNFRRASNLRELLAKNMCDSYVAFQR